MTTVPCYLFVPVSLLTSSASFASLYFKQLYGHTNANVSAMTVMVEKHVEISQTVTLLPKRKTKHNITSTFL